MLSLYENTMIQVSWSESGGLQISVDDGGIMVDSSESTGEAHVKFDDGSVVQIDAGSSLAAQADSLKSSKNVEIKSGTAQITTEAGDEMDLVVGESVNVSKYSLATVITVVFYSATKVEKKNDLTNVDFEWKN